MIGDDLVILCFFLAKKSKNLLLISVDFIQFTIGIKIAKKTIIIFAQDATEEVEEISTVEALLMLVKEGKTKEQLAKDDLVQNKSWLISVEDDGPGTNLTEEQLVRPFVKGSEQLNQGTGLGLSIVQKLIKLNNGELKFAKSTYGGLKVTISFEIQ